MDKARLSVQRLYAAERRDSADALEDRAGYVPWLLLGQVHTLVCMDAQQDLNAVFGPRDALEGRQLRVMTAWITLRGAERAQVMADVCWDKHVRRIDTDDGGEAATPAWEMIVGGTRLRHKTSRFFGKARHEVMPAGASAALQDLYDSLAPLDRAPGTHVFNRGGGTPEVPPRPLGRAALTNVFRRMGTFYSGQVASLLRLMDEDGGGGGDEVNDAGGQAAPPPVSAFPGLGLTRNICVTAMTEYVDSHPDEFLPRILAVEVVCSQLAESMRHGRQTAKKHYDGGSVKRSAELSQRALASLAAEATATLAPALLRWGGGEAWFSGAARPPPPADDDDDVDGGGEVDGGEEVGDGEVEDGDVDGGDGDGDGEGDGDGDGDGELLTHSNTFHHIPPHSNTFQHIPTHSTTLLLWNPSKNRVV